MTNANNLSGLSTDKLVSLFVSIAVQQDEAELTNNGTDVVNKLIVEIKDIQDELKSRPGDQRHALVILFDHQNPNVRIWAATLTLALVPEKARAVLEDLRRNCRGPQRGQAGARLSNLDSGIFKPS